MGWAPLILCVVIGTGLLRLLDQPRRSLHPLGLVALAFWLGLLTSTFIVTAIAVITRRFYFEIVWVLAVAAVAAIVLRRPSFWRDYARAWRPLPDIARSKEPFFWVEIAVIILATGFFVKNMNFGVAIATDYPITAIDAVGNFAIKARLWFDTRDLFPHQLLNPEYLMYKRCYPPVIPVGESLWAAVMGEWDDRQIKWLFSGCWIATGLLILAVLRERGAVVTAWFGMAFWIVFPVNISYHWGGAIDGFADTPLAMSFVAAALALGWAWNRPATWRETFLIAILLAGPFMIKKEGLVLFALALGLLAWRRLPLRQLGLIAGVGVIFYFVHWLTTIGVPKTHEKDVSFALPLAELGRRLWAFGPILVEEMGKGNKWGNRLWKTVFFFWLFKMIFTPRRQWFNREVILFCVMSVVYSMILLFTIFHFHQNFDCAFERLFIHLLPFLIIASCDGWPASPVMKFFHFSRRKASEVPYQGTPARRGPPSEVSMNTRSRLKMRRMARFKSPRLTSSPLP